MKRRVRSDEVHSDSVRPDSISRTHVKYLGRFLGTSLALSTGLNTAAGQDSQGNAVTRRSQMFIAQVQINQPPARRSTDELVAFINQFRGNYISPESVGHPVTRSEQPAVLFQNLLSLQRVLDVVRQYGVANATERAATQSTYDAAVAIWRTPAEAVRNLRIAQMIVVSELAGHIPASLAAGVGTQSDAVLQLLTTIRSTPSAIYLQYAHEIAELSRRLRSQEVDYRRQQIPVTEVIPVRPYREQLSTVIPLMFGNGAVTYSFGNVTDELSRTFGSDAQGFSRSYGRAAAIVYGPSGSTPYNAADVVSDLRTSLVAARAAFQNDSNFRAALDSLDRGDLQGAVESLRRVGPLTGSLNQLLDSLYTMRINQQGASVFWIGGRVEFPLTGQTERVRDWIQNPSGVMARLTEVALAVRQSWFAWNAEYERLGMRLNPATGRLEASPAAGSRGTFSGTGQLTTLTPELTWTVGAFRRAFDLRVHCEIGFRDFEGSSSIRRPPTAVTRPGEVDTLRTSEADMRESGDWTLGGRTVFVGVWGVDISPRARPNEQMSFVVPRTVSLAGYGDRGFLASATFAFGPDRSEGVRFQTFVTPQFSYFAGSVRNGTIRSLQDLLQLEGITHFGATVTPQLTIPLGGTANLIMRPSLSYQYNLAGDAHRLQPSGTIALELNRGLAIEGTLGYGFALGSQAAGREPPNTIFGGFNLNIVPEQIFSPRRTSARPRYTATSIELPISVRNAYQQAVEYLRQFPDEAQGDAGAQRARALSTVLGRGVEATPLTENDNFLSALSLLGSGRFIEGMERLRTIDEFRALEVRRSP